MVVGVPKEVKPSEYRVSMLPVGVEQLTQSGHTVLVEVDAGIGSGIPDVNYIAAGAKMCHSPSELYDAADLVVKVGQLGFEG